jgi:hypothetical protein
MEPDGHTYLTLLRNHGLNSSLAFGRDAHSRSIFASLLVPCFISDPPASTTNSLTDRRQDAAKRDSNCRRGEAQQPRSPAIVSNSELQQYLHFANLATLARGCEKGAKRPLGVQKLYLHSSVIFVRSIRSGRAVTTHHIPTQVILNPPASCHLHHPHERFVFKQ